MYRVREPSPASVIASCIKRLGVMALLFLTYLDSCPEETQGKLHGASHQQDNMNLAQEGPIPCSAALPS